MCTLFFCGTWLNWDSSSCEQSFVLIPYIVIFHSWDNFFEGFPEVNFSLYFSLFWRKSLVFSSGCNDSTFERSPKYHFQCYCIHLAFSVFPAIWFQSLMKFVEDASYESRISDGCWTRTSMWSLSRAEFIWSIFLTGKRLPSWVFTKYSAVKEK